MIKPLEYLYSSMSLMPGLHQEREILLFLDWFCNLFYIEYLYRLDLRLGIGKLLKVYLYNIKHLLSN